MIQPQMMIQQKMMVQQMNNINQGANSGKFKNIIFYNPRSRSISIPAKFGTIVREVLNQYLIEEYGSNNEKICFLFNASKIDLNEHRFVEIFFKNHENPKITVFEYS